MTIFYMSNHEFWYITRVLTLNGSRVMNFQRFDDMAVSDWCHLALGTRSNNPSLSVYNLEHQSNALSHWTHCQSLSENFADF